MATKGIGARLSCHAGSVIPATGQLGRDCWPLPAGSGPLMPGLLAAVGQLLPCAPHLVSCTSWHTLQASPMGGMSLNELPVLPLVPVRTPGPRAMPHLSPAGLIPRASVAGWGLLT